MADTYADIIHLSLERWCTVLLLVLVLVHLSNVHVCIRGCTLLYLYACALSVSQVVRHHLLSIENLVECLEERPEPASTAREPTDTRSDAGDEERSGCGGGRGWDARRGSDEAESGPRRLQATALKGPMRKSRASWQLVYLREPALFFEDHLPVARAKASRLLHTDTSLPPASTFAQLTSLCAPRALLVFASVRKHMYEF